MCSDVALVMKIRSGDKKALGTLVERHKKLAFRLALYTIISNLCRTWLSRRSRRESRQVSIDAVSFLLVAEDNPEAAMMKKELVGQLRRALKQLPFDDREIITLQHFRGMSYGEIATLLDIPRGTVMSRLYYARKKLANLMKEDDARG
jgi:RNA polymerase sigma-70 factor (ECF subfamily)